MVIAIEGFETTRMRRLCAQVQNYRFETCAGYFYTKSPGFPPDAEIGKNPPASLENFAGQPGQRGLSPSFQAKIEAYLRVTMELMLAITRLSHETCNLEKKSRTNV
jgi:hypothetical protein